MTKHPASDPFLALAAAGSGFRGGRWKHPHWNFTFLILVSPCMLNCIKDLVFRLATCSSCVSMSIRFGMDSKGSPALLLEPPWQSYAQSYNLGEGMEAEHCKLHLTG
ncbi:uncharacterized protein PS065_018325 isoform 1-T1 [Dugong dugon]